MKKTILLSTALTALSLHSTHGSGTHYSFTPFGNPEELSDLERGHYPLPSFVIPEELSVTNDIVEEGSNSSTMFNQGATGVKMTTNTYQQQLSPEDLAKILEDDSQDEQETAHKQSADSQTTKFANIKKWIGDVKEATKNKYVVYIPGTK